MSQLHRHLNKNSSHRYTTTTLHRYNSTQIHSLLYNTLSSNSLSYLLLVISSVRVAHSASLNMGQAIKFNLLHTFSSPLFAFALLAIPRWPRYSLLCLLLCNKENAFDLHHNSCLLTLKTESPLTPPHRSLAAPHVAASGEIYWMSWLSPDSSAWYTHTHTKVWGSPWRLPSCLFAAIKNNYNYKTDERSSVTTYNIIYCDHCVPRLCNP